MATIRPFEGLRYSEAAGPLADLVAPPYDVLSPQERNEYAAMNPRNVVHLTLPEGKADDRSKFVKYARSGAALADWRKSGALELEKRPTFYRYTQTFKIPGDTAEYTRQALIALIKVEPYEKGVVLPHEQTFPKHKEDRLRLLEATRAHLECIYGLFEDEGGRVYEAIRMAPSTGCVRVATSEGVHHTLHLVQDSETLDMLSGCLANRKVWIADGHHRYETALIFRAALGERQGLIAEDFMMMALSSMADPGLVLLPTHRIVQKLSIPERQLDDLFQTHFNVRKVANNQLREALAAFQCRQTIQNPKSKPQNQFPRAFGVALPSGTGLLLSLDNPEDALDWVESEGSDRLKLLDVTLLHEVIFGKLLGLRGLDFFSYTRDPDEALRAVSEGGAAAAFLMNPPSVEDMRQIALGGEKMPQKSTYYYPKILSGLVVWALSDFKQ